MRIFIGFGFGLFTLLFEVVALHIWDLKNTIKEHEKRIAELEKKLK